MGTIVDDVAVCITLVTRYYGPYPNKPIDSMGGVKSNKTNPAFTPILLLLNELDNSGSWWDLAFKPKAGGRQLLIHNQYLVTFQASASSGGPFKISGGVASPYAPSTFAFTNYFALVREILAGLCDWLDRLEVQLVAMLQAKIGSWSSPAHCSSFYLPVAYPEGNTRFDPTYFPLPLCDGSDPLPWNCVTVLLEE